MNNTRIIQLQKDAQALADKATKMKEDLQTVVNPFHDTLAAIRAAVKRKPIPRKTKQGESK